VQPRYYNAPDADIKEYVFNYDECEKGRRLIIVEGAFSAMSMYEKGFRNTVATFGTEFKSSQIQKIFSLGPSEVILCLDRDSGKARAGQRAAVKLGAIINELLPVSIMPLPYDKDPNDLSEEVLTQCFKCRFSYNKISGG
jgi:DNA primase